MKMIVLTGPQGSGNHLFGKIFSIHEDVHGWKDALTPEGYFIPHHKEPFNFYWNNIDQIDRRIMGGKEYAVTSISTPYIETGMPKVPPILEFVKSLEDIGIETQVVVIGRDKNILSYQQERLRGGPTWGDMVQVVKHLDNPFFASQELLYLYRNKYVKSLGKWLDFPMDWESPLIAEILKSDANSKYIQPIGPTALDDHVRSILSKPNS